jgi:hypothetical protein
MACFFFQETYAHQYSRWFLLDFDSLGGPGLSFLRGGRLQVYVVDRDRRDRLALSPSARCRAALLAPPAPLAVRADATPSTLLAIVALSAVRADAAPSAVLAIIAMPAV